MFASYLVLKHYSLLGIKQLEISQRKQCDYNKDLYLKPPEGNE